MKKTKKTGRTRRRRARRRFVRLTRAHLEMSGRLTGDEDKRYAITALCVRRAGDAVLVKATDGCMVWRYSAEWVDAKDLPDRFAGEEIADGQSVLIDPATAKLCLRALPKAGVRDDWKSAYLAVGGDGFGVLHTHGGASFRLTHYADDGPRWPDFDEGEFVGGRAPLCVPLNVERLRKITTWVSKFVSVRERDALVLSFSEAGSKLKVHFDVDREGGPIGTLMPVLLYGDPLGKAMPAWRAAFGEAAKGGEEHEG